MEYIIGSVTILIIAIIVLVMVKVSKNDDQDAAKNIYLDEMEARRNQYKMSSTAKIDYESFFSSGKGDKSHLFAKYLSDACEENIPIITNMFVKVNSDKKQIESEVAAFLYFSSKILMKASELDYSEIDIKCSVQTDNHDRYDNTYWDRQLIYEDIYFGKPVRAYWDPSGDLSKSNTNALIACFMAMSDFVWEPNLKGATHYDEYYYKPLTIKSIDQAMQFQMVYAEASMQVALFMEMVAGTARNLGLI